MQYLISQAHKSYQNRAGHIDRVTNRGLNLLVHKRQYFVQPNSNLSESTVAALASDHQSTSPTLFITTHTLL